MYVIETADGTIVGGSPDLGEAVTKAEELLQDEYVRPPSLEVYDLKLICTVERNTDGTVTRRTAGESGLQL